MKLSDCLNALLPPSQSNTFTLFKHISNRDIAFKIDSFVKRSDDFQFAITWFNVVNSNNVFQIDYDLIQIKNSDLHKWETVDVQAGRILRNDL